MQIPDYYHSKIPKLKGSSRMEVERKARNYYNTIDKRTKRRQTFVRSAYFANEKVFLKTFWDHIYQKSQRDRWRRLRYYICAIDLIINNKRQPIQKSNGKEILYRFYGLSRENSEFIVQIRKDKNNKKYHMSVFPPHHED